MIAYTRVIEAALSQGLGVEKFGDRAMVQCPVHNDGRPSLSVRPIEGSVLLYCMAGCDTKDVVEHLHLSMGDLFDDSEGFTYRYPGGREVTRTPDKRFLQTGNKADTSLFGSDRIKDTGPVFVVEGEKDVLALQSVGGSAVSTPMGASTDPGRFDWEPLRGRTVLVVADQDEPGRKRAKRLCEYLEPIGGSVASVDPATGKDAADHIAAGYGLNDFKFDTPEDILTLSQAFDAWRDWLDSEQSEPIPTPWPSLNKALAGGLHPGRVYVVAARTGQGKSVIGQNIVTHAATLRRTALVVSVEMPVREVVSRIIAAEASVDYSDLTRRDFDDAQVRVDQFIQSHRGLPMYICDNPTVTVEHIAQKCRALKSVGLETLFLDYAQLVSASDRRVSREQQVAHIARSVKVLAMELNISVVLAAQLNRGNETDNRQPRISDLRESGELEQSADVILLLHQEPNSPSTIVNVAKNRTGPPKSISLIRRFDQARLDAI